MSPYFTTTDDLLRDPLTQALMRADRVDPAALKVELGKVADRIAARPRPLSLAGARVRFGWEPRGFALAPPPPREGCDPRLCC